MPKVRAFKTTEWRWLPLAYRANTSGSGWVVGFWLGSFALEVSER